AAAQTQAEWAQRQQMLEARAARLDARELQLERLRQQLQQAQRETLEMRLATEELWGQLSGTLPAAALTKSVSRLRNRLADQFKLAADDLADQREAVEQSRTRLETQLERLVQQRSELQQW